MRQVTSAGLGSGQLGSLGGRWGLSLLGSLGGLGTGGGGDRGGNWNHDWDGNRNHDWDGNWNSRSRGGWGNSLCGGNSDKGNEGKDGLEHLEVFGCIISIDFRRK